jgi:hypothetical protein
MKKLSVLAITLICSLGATSVFASDRDCPSLNKLKTKAFKDNQILLKGDDGFWIELKNGSTLTADVNERSEIIYVVKRHEPQGGMAIVKTTVNKDGKRPSKIKLKRSKYSRVLKKRSFREHNNNTLDETSETPEWNAQSFSFDTYQNYHRDTEDSPARTRDLTLEREFHVDYLYKKQGKLKRHTRKTKDGAGDRRQLYLFDGDNNDPNDSVLRKRVSTNMEYYETDSGKNLQCVDFMVKRSIDDADVTIEVIDLDAPQTGGGARVRKQIRILFGPTPAPGV